MKSLNKIYFATAVVLLAITAAIGTTLGSGTYRAAYVDNGYDCVLSEAPAACSGGLITCTVYDSLTQETYIVYNNNMEGACLNILKRPTP